ncbi:MAG: pilus assembly protein [Gemmataceae bacterium]|nr:pilus assembly protein [Gemmataceae bacterium]MCI0639931.1 pilus assembly protein [Gemmataceae bacterium]MCI0741178.1 pilus assembly protein [Gemmataceae bacterium]
MRLNCQSRRSGVTIIEGAVVYPLVFFLLIALIVGAIGIFRYQEMSWLAQEGARYAVVRGLDYEIEMKTRGLVAKAVTEADIRNYLRGKAQAINGNDLQVKVSWQDLNKAYTVISNQGNAEVNTITVTVTYQWLPELFLVGPIDLTATCTIPMSY